MNGYTSRISEDLMWLQVCFVLSQRSTCARRRVGCVLVDKQGRFLSSGRNGSASGDIHCIDHPCEGVLGESGAALDTCEAIHAEQNALAYCPDVRLVHTVYCTDSPCVPCVKLLKATGAIRLVFARRYPHTLSQSRWERQGRSWEHIPLPGLIEVLTTNWR